MILLIGKTDKVRVIMEHLNRHYRESGSWDCSLALIHDHHQWSTWSTVLFTRNTVTFSTNTTPWGSASAVAKHKRALRPTMTYKADAIIDYGISRWFENLRG